MMKCSLVFCVICLCGMASAAQTVDVRAWLDAEIPGRLATTDVPAMIVSVVSGPETIIAGYGVDADRAIFRVGSLSKPVTASLVMLQAAAGLIDLHADIRGELTSLPVRPPLTEPLTMHHLLTHTAGFNERLFGQHAATAERFLTLGRYLERHLPPRFIRPGEIIAYNDHHTAMAGWIAERRGGRPFADLVRERIFEPLGMHDSSFEQVSLPVHMVEHLAKAYDGIGGRPYPRDYLQLPPAAGLYTTAPDMARYIRALLTGELAGSAQQLSVQFRHHPLLPGRAYGFAEGHHGAMIYLFKDGQASGFNARLLLVPDRQFGLFMAHNRNIFGPFGRIEPAGRLLRELGSDLLSALWPLPDRSDAPAGRKTGTAMTFSTDLTPFTGTYRTVVAARHTWERLASLFDEVVVHEDDGLLALGSRRYRPEGPELFVNVESPRSHIAFRMANGQPTHLFIGGGAYERVPAWTGQAALPWIVGVPLLILLISGWRLFSVESWRVVFGQLALVGCFVGLALVFALVDLQRLFQGPPPVLLAVLGLPFVAMLGLGLQALRFRGPRPWARLSCLAAGTVLIVWLAYWHLLGYQLG